MSIASLQAKFNKRIKVKHERKSNAPFHLELSTIGKCGTFGKNMTGMCAKRLRVGKMHGQVK